VDTESLSSFEADTVRVISSLSVLGEGESEVEAEGSAERLGESDGD
jgi:hypothetical protein